MSEVDAAKYHELHCENNKHIMSENTEEKVKFTLKNSHQENQI